MICVATVLLAALALAVAQSDCGAAGTYGQQCNNKAGCACNGSTCDVKPCFLLGGSSAGAPSGDDLALCNVNNATTFFLSNGENSFSPTLVIRGSPLRIVTGSAAGGQGLLSVSVRVKSAGCSVSEQAQLSQKLRFSTAADGALLVDVGGFVSLAGNVNTSQCNSWTRPDAEAAKAREAALDKQCPWRLEKDFSCGPVSTTNTMTTVILDGRPFYTSTSTTSSPVSGSSSSAASGSTAGSNAQQSSAIVDEMGNSAAAPAVSSVALCAAAAVAALNRAPWHVQAAAGVAGLVAAANAQQSSTCDVWIEVLGQTSGGGFVSTSKTTNGTDVVLRFGVAVPGRPFVDSAGKAIVTGVVENKNDTKAAPSAICPRKSGTGSLLTSALIEAASAELAAAAPGDAEAWLMQATAEHASVASFAQFSLNLMANAAPSPLLASALRAAQDEVLHADACLAMARAVSSKSASFEAFPAGAIDGMRAQSLGDLALSTLREGGIAELVSTLDAVVSVGEALSRQQASVAGVWRAIATDESRHALLAWRTIAWAVRREPALVDALAREIEATAQAVASSARHSATVERVVKPLFACVRAATFEDEGAAIDERVTSALNALELGEFNVDAVMIALREAVLC